VSAIDGEDAGGIAPQGFPHRVISVTIITKLRPLGHSSTISQGRIEFPLFP